MRIPKLGRPIVAVVNNMGMRRGKIVGLVYYWGGRRMVRTLLHHVHSTVAVAHHALQIFILGMVVSSPGNLVHHLAPRFCAFVLSSDFLGE